LYFACGTYTGEQDLAGKMKEKLGSILHAEHKRTIGYFKTMNPLCDHSTGESILISL
jgi:hypothetical protein